MTTDVVMTENADGIYDFSWTDDGDIETSESLDTAILMSIFCEQRALASEIPTASQRRGWIGNESTPNFEMGSKLWLFEQERITATMLSEIGRVLTNAFDWMIEDDIAVAASAEAALNGGDIVTSVTLERSSSEVDKKFYTLWNNTGATL